MPAREQTQPLMQPLAPKFRQTVTRAAELVASPWKNGGGVTREIAIGLPVRNEAPGGDNATRFDTFAWRVSLADVAQPGPFSRFDGIDRVLVLLSGAGMLLDEADIGDGARHTHALLKPLDIARFAGEAAIDARLVDGPTRDFNLMTRRGVASGEVDVWRSTGTHTVSAHVVLLFCVDGEMTVGIDGETPVKLAKDDTLLLAAGATSTTHEACPPSLEIDTQGNGALLAVHIDLHDTTRSKA
jgi:uncharacterized protein